MIENILKTDTCNQQIHLFILRILTHNKMPGVVDVCRTHLLNIKMNHWMACILPILTQNKTLGALMCSNITGYT